jgi:hypothetical protein
METETKHLKYINRRLKMSRQNRKSQKITVTEFKSWINGIREITGDDWIPNKEQWAMILEKIDNLVEPSDRKVLNAIEKLVARLDTINESQNQQPSQPNQTVQQNIPQQMPQPSVPNIFEPGGTIPQPPNPRTSALDSVKGQNTQQQSGVGIKLDEGLGI